jgi:very-short-patch-repair endonuclease
MNVHNKKSLESIRRDLRQRSTKAEKILWPELRSRRFEGKKFKRQHSIGNYIVDFYCSSSRLIIELDGEVHQNKEQQITDAFRDENLKDMGFKVLRLSNDLIIHDINCALIQIKVLL